MHRFRLNGIHLLSNTQVVPTGDSNNTHIMYIKKEEIILPNKSSLWDRNNILPSKIDMWKKSVVLC